MSSHGNRGEVLRVLIMNSVLNSTKMSTVVFLCFPEQEARLQSFLEIDSQLYFYYLKAMLVFLE